MINDWSGFYYFFRNGGFFLDYIIYNYRIEMFCFIRLIFVFDERRELVFFKLIWFLNIV